MKKASGYRRQAAGRSGEYLEVTDIFASIQGESATAGLPCSFVRLSGCNLRCSYCDTKYAWEGGKKMTVASIVAKISEMGHHLVCITGGEPLMQAGAKILIKELLRLGHDVQVETNGSLPIRGLPSRARKIVDVKTPGSGFASSFLKSNLAALSRRDELKFVVSDRKDFDWSVRFIRRHHLEDKCGLLISPVYGLNPSAVARWLIESGLEARLNLQLHKIIWGAKAKAV